MEQKIKYIIPTSFDDRAILRHQVTQFVSSLNFVPPISMKELVKLSSDFISEKGIDVSFAGWIMVEINNAVWKEIMASIPADRRVLLLPKCLSSSSKCNAQIDDIGLLCNRCGSCKIMRLEDEAAAVGSLSIVAEGFTSVVGLIENNVVDAVIGVSCLDSLEKAYPLLIDNAIPGIAISLNRDGCKDTDVDDEYVLEMLNLSSDKKYTFLDYNALKDTVDLLFDDQSLNILTPSKDITTEIAYSWLKGDGKRWRPYLLIATYSALSGVREIPNFVKLAAVAVECFHKASLIHDDIEDNDEFRYGKPTIYSKHGIPMAINAGDVLLGEGYKLLAKANKIKLISLVADAHTSLCKGQGLELAWCKNPRTLKMDNVYEIIENKTIPAFNVALAMGAMCADADESVIDILAKYSYAIGLSYQLNDDVDDFIGGNKIEIRPTSVIAAICERADESFVNEMLHADDLILFFDTPEKKSILQSALNRVRNIIEDFRQQAIDSLHDLKSAELKSLLFRITIKILKQR